MSLPFAVGLALVIAGGLWPLITRKISPTNVLGAPLLLVLAGVGLIEWHAMLLLLTFAACTFVYLRVSTAEDRKYRLEFPVFKQSPIEVFERTDGTRLNLHIAKVGAGFIVGIKYLDEGGDSIATIETSWRDVFPDYESAYTELINRLTEFVSTGVMPNPSIERTPPGRPVSASHVKRSVP